MKCNGCNDKETPRCTHTLIVEKQGTTTNDDGQIDQSDSNWSTQFKIRAYFRTKGGRESRAFNQTSATTDTIIRTPATANVLTIDPSYRLRLGTRIFNIETVFRVDEISKEVQIEATERRQTT